MNQTSGQTGYAARWRDAHGCTYETATMTSPADAMEQAVTLLTHYDIPAPVAGIAVITVENQR